MTRIAKIETKPNITRAILALAPGAQFIRDTKVITEWLDPDITQPTQAEIDAKHAELIAEWTSQEYAHNRQNEYPDWEIQLNKIYDDGLTKWKTEMIDPIKAKWPKDNSGPIE